MKWIIKHRRSLILGFLLVGSLIGMADFKSRYEWAIIEKSPSAIAFDIYFRGARLLFIATVTYIILTWLYGKWAAYQQLKQEHARAELALLRSQLDPHFFFNTLNNLYGLSVEGSKQAPKMILQLSAMMRYTLYEGTADWVPLQKELDYLQQYIALHKLRYHKQVDINVQVDMGKEEYKIAPLLLIVLLENAFKHGVDRMLNNAYLRVGLKADKQCLTYTVENNFDPTIEPKQGGIGLQNLKKRLALLYPTKHQLELREDTSTFYAQLKLNWI